VYLNHEVELSMKFVDRNVKLLDAIVKKVDATKGSVIQLSLVMGV